MLCDVAYDWRSHSWYAIADMYRDVDGLVFYALRLCKFWTDSRNRAILGCISRVCRRDATQQPNPLRGSRFGRLLDGVGMRRWPLSVRIFRERRSSRLVVVGRAKRCDCAITDGQRWQNIFPIDWPPVIERADPETSHAQIRWNINQFSIYSGHVILFTACTLGKRSVPPASLVLHLPVKPSRRGFVSILFSAVASPPATSWFRRIRRYFEVHLLVPSAPQILSAETETVDRFFGDSSVVSKLRP